MDAMNVNGGDIENATTSDYVMHFLTFGFKVTTKLLFKASVGLNWSKVCSDTYTDCSSALCTIAVLFTYALQQCSIC